MDIRVTCDECNFEFSVNTVNIKESTVSVNNQELRLVYFTCPKCNKIYKVTLKDKRYDELKEDLEKTKKRIRKNYGSKNNEMARTLHDMVTAKHNRLKNHVTNLNNKFNGTFTFVASKNNHEEKIIIYLP